MTKKQSAILWDLDNTLIPSSRITQKVLEDLFPEFNLTPPTRKQLQKNFSGTLEEFLRYHSNDHPEHPEITKRFKEAQQAHYAEIMLFEGIIEVIEELSRQGFKHAIVTSRGTVGRGAAGTHEIIKRSGLEKHIDVVICADDVTNHKPHPEPLLLALEKLEVHPEQAIMIGDQIVDMQAAKSAQTYAVGIDHDNSHAIASSLIVAGADEVVNNPHAIVPIAIKLVS